jgi:hypothetical protein
VEDPQDAVDDEPVGLPGVTWAVVGREQGLDDGVVVVAEGVPESVPGRPGVESGGLSTLVVCGTTIARQALVAIPFNGA